MLRQLQGALISGLRLGKPPPLQVEPPQPGACAALAPLAAMFFCACGSPDSSHVVARFELPGPPSSSEGPLTNEQGLFLLETAGAYVALSVSSADMEAVKDTWPDEAADYSPGTDYVDLELKVPAGDDRTVLAIAFLFADGRPYAFLQGAELSVDLKEGETKEVTIELLEAEVGQVSGTAPTEVAEVWLVDVGETVLLSSVVADNGAYEFPFAPLNRELAVDWVDTEGKAHSDSAQSFVLTPDVPKHTRDLQP